MERAERRGRVTSSEPGRVRIVGSDGVVDARFPIEREAPRAGDWVVASGVLVDGELIEAHFEVLGRTQDDFPTSSGEWMAFHGTTPRAAHLRKRARIMQLVRAFFDGRGFVEVETPLAVPSPGLDLHLSAFEVSGFTSSGGAATRYLITSPEYQMKRLIAGGLTDIYQVCKCFRRDEVGSNHQPEFTMLEWYRGFADAEHVIEDTESLVAHVALGLLGSTIIPARGRPIDVAPPWPRISVEEAFQSLAGISLASVVDDEERFFRIWVDAIEPKLGRDKPTFVTRWPASMASLARLTQDDDRFAERVELYVDGLELSNGFAELVDAAEQRARLERDARAREEQGLARYPIDERFLAALEEGLPPSGGNALGLDRLVMLMTGARELDEVIAFGAARL